jgi:hypothetical protein
MNLIYTHRSGGRIWQGDKNDVKALLQRPNKEVDLIGLFAQEFQPTDPNNHYELLRGGYDDNDAANDDELKKVGELASHFSDRFAVALREGKGCVSSCNMGLNRSGLVTALTLMKATHMGPEEAISLVRRNRTPQQGLSALCNRKFVEMIRKLGATSGSKSTWTKWNRESPKARR